jgi:hypothetical protein
MKIPRLTKTQESLFGWIAAVPFFSAGLWAMWKGHLIGASGRYSPTKFQPIGVVFKGATRYVSQDMAHAYNQSNNLFHWAFLYFLGIIVIAALINRARTGGDA